MGERRRKRKKHKSNKGGDRTHRSYILEIGKNNLRKSREKTRRKKNINHNVIDP